MEVATIFSFPSCPLIGEAKWPCCCDSSRYSSSAIKKSDCRPKNSGEWKIVSLIVHWILHCLYFWRHILLQITPERRSPLVTLADLQKVRLRRSNSNLPLKFRSSLGRWISAYIYFDLKQCIHFCFIICAVLCRTPTKNSMNLRVQLRKVNLMRQDHLFTLSELEQRQA